MYFQVGCHKMDPASELLDECDHIRVKMNIIIEEQI